MSFPTHRMRRLRGNSTIRRMVQRTRLSADDFVMPLFVRTGTQQQQSITSMPGQYQWSVDTVVPFCHEVYQAGVPAVLLFGIPDSKDPVGSSSFYDDGVVQQAVAAIKQAVPGLVVITDVCLCEYTDHGHCGVLATRHSRFTPRQSCDNLQGFTSTSGTAQQQSGYTASRDGSMVVDNDDTLQVLARQAVSHARSGADVIAPSDMMDGRVGVIRQALDQAGFTDVPILSYAAKFASAMYGPFRDAAESGPQFGDRRSYQMDYTAGDLALREVELDIDEGADMVMVKPAMAYLDVIRQVRDAFPWVPLACYNVSGEYAMVKAAAANGWLDERAVVMESLTAMKRAGADMILTYWAVDAAKWLGGEGAQP